VLQVDILAIIVTLLLGSAPTHAAELGGSSARGKQIYAEGTSMNGTQITAIVGDEAVSLPASAVPCASCHGNDGIGRPEGGVTPLDIRWTHLMKSYGHVHEDGRRHPAFDDAGVVRVIAAGIDPAGNRLDTAMPLYQLSEQDMADLVAYLRELETDFDAGLEDSRIQVGTVLPFSGPRAAVGQAMAQVMHAYFQDLNQTGGIYGRQIDLLNVPMGRSPDQSVSNLQAACEAEGIFAVVGAYTIGMDEEMLAFTRARELPMIAPFTLDPGDSFLDAAAFYLYPGFSDQARVMVDRALAQVDGSANVLVIGEEGGRFDGVLSAVRAQFQLHDVAAPEELRYSVETFKATELADRSGKLDPQALLFFGGQRQLSETLYELARRDSYPSVYVLSSFLSGPLFDAPKNFDRRLHIAYPMHVSDITDKGRQEYQDLSVRHGLPREHIQAQIAALAAAKLFVEGLRGAGRDLSRERLIDGLEALYGFRTGITPPLSYGPNRRIGARGAHLLTVDLVNRHYATLDGGWHELR
jgi:ABC-type branched-subunit amino acid transport system substrate-binding protein